MKERIYIRNLQLTGGTTYTVSLPKEWIQSLGLDKGSKIYIEILPDGSLRIFAKPREGGEKLSKEILVKKGNDLGSLIRRAIAAYLAGFSDLTLKFHPESRDLAMKVREILESSVLGFSVLKEGKSSYTFFSVISEESISLEDAIFRLYEDTFYMMEDCLEGIKDNNVELLRGVIAQDQLVDKLYLFIVKRLTSALMNPIMVKRYGLDVAAEAPYIFLAVKSMERIADHVSKISEEALCIISMNEKVPRWITEKFEDVKELFDDSVQAFLNPDSGTASKAARVIDKASREIMEGSKNLKNARLQMIINSMNRILSYSLDISEAAIDIEAIREAGRRLGFI